MNKLLLNREECYELGISKSDFKDRYDRGDFDRAIVFVGKHGQYEKFLRPVIEAILIEEAAKSVVVMRKMRKARSPRSLGA